MLGRWRRNRSDLQEAVSDDRNKAWYAQRQEMNWMANTRLGQYLQQKMWMEPFICKEYTKSIGNSHYCQCRGTDTSRKSTKQKVTNRDHTLEVPVLLIPKECSRRSRTIFLSPSQNDLK